jgi:hypothetical protein
MDKSKKEKLIILGRSGSGKDFLLRKLTEKGLKPCLKWTTRPPRKFEQQGVNYNFVDESTFIQSISNGDFLVHQKFLLLLKCLQGAFLAHGLNIGTPDFYYIPFLESYTLRSYHTCFHLRKKNVQSREAK